MTSKGKLEFGKPKGESAKYLNEYFLNKFRFGYVTCKDVVMPEYYTEFADRILEMDIRSDDIWVSSFPKTGTTWVQEMVWCVANEADLQKAESRLSGRFPFLERNIIFDTRRVNSETSLPANLRTDSISTAINLPPPRFIRTHLPFKLLPKKLQNHETGAKIVYVTRNPRDACVSSYHHNKLLEGFSGSLDVFCELFLDGNVLYGPFFDHVKGYWEQRNNANILLLKYEDMKQDLGSVIRKLADFFGKTLTDEQVEKLVDHLSFETMKKNPAVNREHIVQEHKKHNMTAENGSLMRKGKIGSWKEEMSPEMIERFEKWEKDYFNTNKSFGDFCNFVY